VNYYVLNVQLRNRLSNNAVQIVFLLRHISAIHIPLFSWNGSLISYSQYSISKGTWETVEQLQNVVTTVA